MPRRRSLPEPLAGSYRAFAGCADALERAKAALLRAIPAARVPAVPLAEALLAFREGLDRADASMAAWRTPAVEAEWVRCADGLAAARAAEASLRLLGGGFAHDVFLARLGDLIAPLDPFEDAAHRFASLARSRGSRGDGAQPGVDG